MNFCSDNVTGVHPEIFSALLAANAGAAMGYGHDEITLGLEQKFSDLFETEVTVFPVATGSAANALALATITPPFGAIYCHQSSHINCDECGAPEFFTSGAKLVTLAGEGAQFQADALAATLAQAGAGVVHHVQPAAVSISQVTEAGTVYSLDHIAEIAEVSRHYGLHLHMDGARFANAVVSLNCSPAAMTWKAGVNVLSFGATKNGAMAAEAVIFFGRALANTFEYRRKRGGHLFSKMRFLSAQLDAYINNDLWLRNASHANQMARQLASSLSNLPNIKFCTPVEANEVFLELPEQVIESLLQKGFQFYRWSPTNPKMIRLVTAFDTKEEDIAALIQEIRSLVGCASKM